MNEFALFVEEIVFRNGKIINNVHCILKQGFLLIPDKDNNYICYNQNIIISMNNVKELTSEEWEEYINNLSH